MSVSRAKIFDLKPEFFASAPIVAVIDDSGVRHSVSESTAAAAPAASVPSSIVVDVAAVAEAAIRNPLVVAELSGSNLRCVTCKADFKSNDEFHAHFRSDWHRFACLFEFEMISRIRFVDQTQVEFEVETRRCRNCSACGAQAIA